MKITRISAFAIKIPRDVSAARGTAGSPAPLQSGVSDYRFAATYQTLYSTKIETALIKIETDAGTGAKLAGHCVPSGVTAVS